MKRLHQIYLMMAVKFKSAASIGGMWLKQQQWRTPATVDRHMIDTHVHLVSEDSGRYPRCADPPLRTAGYTWTVEQFLVAMNEAGVTKATVVQPFGVYGLDNSYQADEPPCTRHGLPAYAA